MTNGGPRAAVCAGKKNAAKRPVTKEGGREEEKSRLGIASMNPGVRTASQQQKGVGVLPLGKMDSLCVRPVPAGLGPGGKFL